MSHKKPSKLHLRYSGIVMSSSLLIFCAACEDVIIGSEQNLGPETTEAGAAEKEAEFQAILEAASTLPPNNQLDLLFVVDNTVGIERKAELLEEAVPRFMDRLLSPPDSKADSPLIDDIHIGVITSSLGGHGSVQCRREADDSEGISYNFDDRGYLIPKVRQSASNPDEDGVLRWSGGSEDAKEALVGQVQEHIRAAGNRGCGFEAPLEAWYRFLVDPQPPAEIVLDFVDSQAKLGQGPDGSVIDQDLLLQRAAFLRPQSTVAIVLLTDEDDCSAMDGGVHYTNASYGWLTAEVTRPMRTRTPICEQNPNDECCFSCLQASAPPSGCDASACAVSDENLPPELDRGNTRCFDQKGRFGVDLLYPVERYTSALTQASIVDARTGERVENPLIMSTNAPDLSKRVRNPKHIFFTSIVGVPWQDLATANTLDDPERLKLLKPSELVAADPLLDGKNRWDLILGEPNLPVSSQLCMNSSDERCGLAPVPPLDPFMIASIEQRPIGATNPITGDAIVASTSEDPLANAINGHEADHGVIDPRFLPQGGAPANDDLQYACTFLLEEPLNDCKPDDPSCDCGDEPLRKRSLCQPPSGGQAATTQYFAKAYPAPRILQVTRDVGNNGVVGSVCPKFATGDESHAYFGYNPVLNLLADRIWSVR